MSPPTSRTTSRHGAPEPTRFRCGCGRSVAAQRDSEAARTRQCSTCRSRQPTDPTLRRG